MMAVGVDPGLQNAAAVVVEYRDSRLVVVEHRTFRGHMTPAMRREGARRGIAPSAVRIKHDFALGCAVAHQQADALWAWVVAVCPAPDVVAVETYVDQGPHRRGSFGWHGPVAAQAVYDACPCRRLVRWAAAQRVLGTSGVTRTLPTPDVLGDEHQRAAWAHACWAVAHPGQP